MTSTTLVACVHTVSTIIHQVLAIDPFDQPFSNGSTFDVAVAINDLPAYVTDASEFNCIKAHSRRIAIKKYPYPTAIPITISVAETRASCSTDEAMFYNLTVRYNLKTGLLVGSGVLGYHGQRIVYVSPYSSSVDFNRIRIEFSVHQFGHLNEPRGTDTPAGRLQ